MIKKLRYPNWKLIVFFAFGFQFFVFAQEESQLPNGVKGLWTLDSSAGELNSNWKAQWIWMPENVESDVMLARRSFSLSEQPKTSRLRISASSKYELYVNGKYVCQGPARSAPHHQSFDVLDISSVLKEGKNTIAVRVHYQRGTTSYHLKGRAGLLVLVIGLFVLQLQSSLLTGSKFSRFSRQLPAIPSHRQVVVVYPDLPFPRDTLPTSLRNPQC